MRRRPRKLSPEDRALWQAYSGGIQRLQQPVPRRPEPPGPITRLLKQRAAPPASPLPTIHQSLPKTSVTLTPDPMAQAAGGAVRMDAKTHGRLKRGKLQPEARIDLHGMTADRAHGALRGFILDAAARGHRLVLVITGKGRSDDPHMAPARRGVLRNAVPQWLAQAPLGGLILQITPAHDRHGGGGAYYVYLKRKR